MRRLFEVKMSSRRVFLFPALVLLVSLCARAQDNTLLIRNATIVDTENGGLRRAMTIRIEDERITGVYKSNRTEAASGTFDAAGLFVIPGLWDMHVHAFWTPTSAERMFPLFLANGVTGIRDMGSPLPLEDLVVLRDRYEQDQRAPRIVMAGKLLDGDPPVWRGSLAARNAEEARKAVEALRQSGFDCVKVYSRLGRQGYFAAAESARAFGLPLVGHVPISISALEAARARQHSIEHLNELLLACSRQEEVLRKELLDAPVGRPRDAVRRAHVKRLVETFYEKKALALARDFQRFGVWQVPTLHVQHTYAYRSPGGFLAEAWSRYLPKSTVDEFTSRLEAFREGKTADELSAQKRSYDRELELVRIMIATGVRFLAGTDAELFHTAGFGLHRELQLLADSGLGASGALRAATINPAHALGRTKDFGSVRNGKMADLVLLEANPLEDIRNSQRIRAVVLKGRLYKRAQLDTMLESVARIAQRQ